MKILHIMPSLDISCGGPVGFVKQLCCELKNQGIDVAIATTNAKGCKNLNTTSRIETMPDSSVPIYYFACRFRSFLPPTFCFSQTLGRWLKEHIGEFDLLHTHYLFSYPPTIAAYYANKYRVPYILGPAGMLSGICLKKSVFKKKLYMLLFEKRNLKNATKIHFTSEEELNAAIKFKLNNRCIVVPNGLELGKFKNMESFKGLFRRRYPQTNGKKIILFLSRIDPLKGLDLLIPALKILSRKRKDFIFVLTGSGFRNEERWLRQALLGAGLTTLTILTGFYEEKMKMAVLADSDVFVLTSYHENFGMAVADAMAAGLPVVISNRVNIYKLIEDYQAGIITELDSRDIAVALDRLLSDEHLRFKMGLQGKKLVQEKFDIKNIAQQIIEIYSQLMREAG